MIKQIETTYQDDTYKKWECERGHKFLTERDDEFGGECPFCKIGPGGFFPPANKSW